MGLGDRIRFVGPRPLAEMTAVFEVADVLVSPRVAGSNTPMKIYSYLDSGKPILATDINSHTQVLNADVAVLAAPRAADLADAMCRLAADTDLRARLAANARALAAEKYSFGTFKDKVDRLYDWVSEQVVNEPRGTRA